MTRTELERMRRGIDELRGAAPEPREVFWGGADVVITPEEIPVDPGAFYTPPHQFITPHPSEATWLFESLRDLLAPVLDAGNKYDFYARLARAGEGHSDWVVMQNAMLDEATRWLHEIAGDVERLMRDPRIH